MWLDGICECGWPVIETDGDDTYDYKNMCLNPKCQHHCWHFCFDTSELEYYKHNSKLGEVIVELLKQPCRSLVAERVVIICTLFNWTSSYDPIRQLYNFRTVFNPDKDYFFITEIMLETIDKNGFDQLIRTLKREQDEITNFLK